MNAGFLARLQKSSRSQPPFPARICMGRAWDRFRPSMSFSSGIRLSAAHMWAWEQSRARTLLLRMRSSLNGSATESCMRSVGMAFWK